MTERVRTVRSGMIGLDLALGGGFRFVRRTPKQDRESATILIRGGPGTGKSVLAEDLALRLAAELGGDALYACLEVLPSEVMAQRMGFENFDEEGVVDLSQPKRKPTGRTAPSLILGMSEIPASEDGPDLGRVLLDFVRVSIEQNYVPKVIVVDSLSDGYGLGTSVARSAVDGLCKLAIEQGWILILIEEAPNDSMSPWTFAVDTVLSLRVLSATLVQAKRQLIVTKHRFGACEPGPHRLQIEPSRVRVIPPLSAYRHAARDLKVPSPSRHRSLRIPMKPGPEPKQFDVEDGEGCVILVRGEPNVTDAVERTAGQVGSVTDSDRETDGQCISLELYESSYKPLRRSTSPAGFSVGTLHQLIDGEEWIEAALDWLSSSENVARVRIGPVERINVYEHKTDIQRAISLLSAILHERGLIVAIFGEHRAIDETIRVGLVRWQWRLFEEAGSDAVRVTYPEPGFTFYPLRKK